MSNDIPRFERMINRINIVNGLQLPVGITTLFVIILWFIRPSYFQAGSLPLYAGMITVVTIVSIIHSLKSESLNKRQLRFIYSIYHIALIIFTVGVAPFLSPFEFLWIALAIGVDLIFGKSSMRITLLVYGLSLIAAFFSTQQSLSVELFFRIITQYLGVVFISLQVSKYRIVSDEERVALKSTTTQNAFERQRLVSLINNMGDAVMATDEKGKILLYNAALLNLLDTNQSLEGTSVAKVLNLKDKKGKSAQLLKKIEAAKNNITTTDYRHYFKNDDFINLYINISPIKLGYKEATQTGYIYIMRDITKEKSLEEERDEFISVVSHELRTPIAVAEGNISNALFITGKRHEPKFVSESLAQAHEQVVFLANMINDLATLSRAERTDVALEITSVEPGQLLEGIENDYRKEAEVKKLKLHTTTAPGTHPVQTSELYLREILQNFVTNALKYTKSGSILVHARSDKSGNAIFSVADTGIGLSKADQKKIFEKFFRSEDYRTRESSGTGLGLYVTAKLAHRINAVISVESELNKGSTFTVTVPNLNAHKK